MEISGRIFLNESSIGKINSVEVPRRVFLKERSAGFQGKEANEDPDGLEDKKRKVQPQLRWIPKKKKGNGGFQSMIHELL